ncbi:quinone oxidoreductase [Bradyrhizobium sp. UFLA05-153]
MPVTAHALKFSKVGSPDVLEWTTEELQQPAADQIQITQRAIGVNYIDIYHRSGLYPLPLPSGVGVEGVGIVEAVGESVKNFVPGDRVVYVGGPPGGYASARNVPAARALKLPDDIPTEVAASLIFKGLTVEYLIRRCHEVKKGDAVLFHAAAGGIGLIAGQWLKHIGATVIGTVSSEEKAKLARANGYDHTIIYTKENFTERVRDITRGEGVSAVYDSIGKDTFAGSLDTLRPRGILISFGTASGHVPPLDLAQLGAKGSLFVTRPSIAHYTAKREELEAAADALFEAIRLEHLKAIETKTYPLREAAQAHRDLEGRKTAGSLILVP